MVACASVESLKLHLLLLSFVLSSLIAIRKTITDSSLHYSYCILFVILQLEHVSLTPARWQDCLAVRVFPAKSLVRNLL